MQQLIKEVEADNHALSIELKEMKDRLAEQA